MKARIHLIAGLTMFALCISICTATANADVIWDDNFNDGNYDGWTICNNAAFVAQLPASGFSESQTPDYWPTEGWLQTNADEQGMNGTSLNEMLSYCDDHDLALQGIMVVRNGYNVLEEYPDSEFNESTLSNTWSVTKSIISILVGIALEEGYISSLDETMVSFFPDRTIANLDSQKESITLRHLLTMKSGLQWSTSDTYLMRQSSDWVQYALDRPMSHTPGETWNYNNGAAHILSAILNNSIGMIPSAFAEIHLFQPLGIDEYEWEVDPQGLNSGGRGLQLTLQDMAKIGFLFINNGTWDAEQIVSSEWVEDSTKVYSTGCAGAGVVSEYGYLWWVKSSYNGYCAFGTDGQFIWVFPQHSMIFVTKASRLPPINYLITEYILPSVSVITTTTTTTTTTPPPPFDWVPIAAIGASAVVVGAVLVIFLKRR